LHNHGIPLAVVNPRRVRDFANAIGMDAKTDPIDAGVIAYYGEVAKPAPQPAKSDEAKKLGALVERRRQLQGHIGQETNRLQQVDDLEIKKFIQKSLEWLKKQLKCVDKRLAKATKQLASSCTASTSPCRLLSDQIREFCPWRPTANHIPLGETATVWMLSRSSNVHPSLGFDLSIAHIRMLPSQPPEISLRLSGLMAKAETMLSCPTKSLVPTGLIPGNQIWAVLPASSVCTGNRSRWSWRKFQSRILWSAPPVATTSWLP
jgi:hypothetical protein